MGVGIALKIDDGARRASEQTLAGILAALLPDAASELRGLVPATLQNWRGIDVGSIRPSCGLRQGLAMLKPVRTA